MSVAPPAHPGPGVTEAVTRPVWDQDVSWQSRGACNGTDPNIFFAPFHLETREEREAREAQAKSICAGCPVQRECLEFALTTREPHGIWGGFNESERRRVQVKRAG